MTTHARATLADTRREQLREQLSAWRDRAPWLFENEMPRQQTEKPKPKLSIDHCPRCQKPCRFAGFAWIGEYKERRAAEFLCVHCGGWFRVEVEAL